MISMQTYKKGGVLEGGGLWCSLTVDGHASLKNRGFADVSRRQGQVFNIEGAEWGEGKNKEQGT